MICQTRKTLDSWFFEIMKSSYLWMHPVLKTVISSSRWIFEDVSIYILTLSQLFLSISSWIMRVETVRSTVILNKWICMRNNAWWIKIFKRMVTAEICQFQEKLTRPQGVIQIISSVKMGHFLCWFILIYPECSLTMWFHSFGFLRFEKPLQTGLPQ